MVRLVQGVGINDGKYPTTLNGLRTKEYALWCDMLKRCYSNTAHISQPSYAICTVSDNFKLYSYFYEWCNIQVGFMYPGYQLDKDLLLKNSKLYSEATCVFLPRKLNTVLEKRRKVKDTSGLPIGVHTRRNMDKFVAQCRIENKIKYLGTYSNIQAAFLAYKLAKENYLKELAEKYKDTIDPRAYYALLNYEVHIDD